MVVTGFAFRVSIQNVRYKERKVELHKQIKIEQFFDPEFASVFILHIADGRE